ncbi:spermine oxidase [Hyalella azteca]|uniref:Spermine oxidase n=1 Tax=Hyalella azteca TaxID=294128 RepID=A0A979FMT6_HYAAZ|nr:spermine oxidase [Hyalella azteca]
MEQDGANYYQVIILGAGVAGLSAANSLLQSQITNFIILEARNRIGGRVVAIDVEGCHLELGASWIHGVLGNPIYELASANGLVPIVQNCQAHTVLAACEDGSKLPFPILQEMYDVYSVFLKRCEEYFLCQYLPPDGVKSVGEHLLLERQLYLDSLPPEQRHERGLVFDYLMRRETCITGVNNLNDLDLMEIGSYTELPGGNISLPTGYTSILKPLTVNIPAEKILKEHSVSVVRWSLPGDCGRLTNLGADEEIATDSSTTSNPKVKISCENGKEFLCDTVICTFPLGVLKNSAATLFQPPLPDSISNALTKLSFGTVDKIFLEYDRPFLSPGLQELILLWEPCDETSEMTDRWYRKIYSFTKVTETLLLAWISGDEAKYMETLPFDTVLEKCTEILRQFLGDPCVPRAKRCICTSWWSQTYTRGSYTAIGVGGSQRDIVTLASPVWAGPQRGPPALLLAGEHCHPSFYSTVHGAYLSGRDAAQLLCKLPDFSPEITLTVEGTADLSSWIHGISLH